MMIYGDHVQEYKEKYKIPYGLDNNTNKEIKFNQMCNTNKKIIL